MTQKTVPSEAAHQALQNKRPAALSDQMWARAKRHLATIQSQPGDILNESCLPLDYALRHQHEDLSRPHIFAPPR
jgi:hypothetical protein